MSIDRIWRCSWRKCDKMLTTEYYTKTILMFFVLFLQLFKNKVLTPGVLKFHDTVLNFYSNNFGYKIKQN